MRHRTHIAHMLIYKQGINNFSEKNPLSLRWNGKRFESLRLKTSF